MTAYVDDTRVPLDGRLGRVICARNRPGMVGSKVLTFVVDPQPITEGADKFGAFLRFAPLAGDQSSTDAARNPSPPRAMIALECMGLVDRFGKRLTQHLGLVVEPVRGVRYGIGIAFYDGRGGPGRAELWINGRQQGKTWRGPSGYAGYGSVYPAVGSYNHPGQCTPPPAVRIYGWRESPSV